MFLLFCCTSPVTVNQCFDPVHVALVIGPYRSNIEFIFKEAFAMTLLAHSGKKIPLLANYNCKFVKSR
jgi:hypothetical protein